MSALVPWVLLHGVHAGGIHENTIALALAGVGFLLIAVGLYRLYTYEEPPQGFEDEQGA